MFDRRLIQHFDWGLLGLTIIFGFLGLVILWYSVGLVLMIASFLFNYKMLERWAHAIYVICIMLLIAVLFFGSYAGGARRWLILGPVSIQPSEIVKIAVIIILASYYSKHANIGGLTLCELVTPLIYTLIPFALIVNQPDLGTAILVILIAGSMTVFVKIEKRSYQKQRILTFLNPDRDPLGAGYHIIQSKIAVGSGMISGKGFLHGTQNILAFLPEQHTDFIFSVLAEEWGFVGSLVVLLFFLMLVVRGLSIAYGCRDTFGAILAGGITILIFLQIVINVGMVTGLMPVVGVPLPFISYGGSSITTMMICIGILMNISMRRFITE
jgi:rod shape determining protein RodA